ncbi:hypothetical protein BDV98DRAFT_111825 [Pterulicium gracile]|uniref:Uncharacterized protein n=1 Tax=Pterulicium gracile TaxID=1884261 RepID=A0A5C3QJ76_9AGAR|nr:hypothetical protein BDV98DRAFT_111825 [Pterula gracilis]
MVAGFAMAAMPDMLICYLAMDTWGLAQSFSYGILGEMCFFGSVFLACGVMYTSLKAHVLDGILDPSWYTFSSLDGNVIDSILLITGAVASICVNLLATSLICHVAWYVLSRSC